MVDLNIVVVLAYMMYKLGRYESHLSLTMKSLTAVEVEMRYHTLYT